MVIMNQLILLCTNRTILWSMMILMPLLGISWILGLFFIIDSDSVAFAWIFTIVNSLQVHRYVASCTEDEDNHCYAQLATFIVNIYL